MVKLRRKGYHVESKTVNVKDSKVKAPFASRLKKLSATLLVVAFSSVGLISTTVMPAQAAATDCPVDISGNNWVESLGGLNTNQLGMVKSDVGLKASENEATIKDKWSGRIVFTSWVPSLMTADWFSSLPVISDVQDLLGTSPSTSPRNIYKVVPSEYGDELKNGYYVTKWSKFVSTTHTNTEKIGPDALIRKGESYQKKWFFDDDLACQYGYVLPKNWENFGPNFIMGMAKATNDIAGFLYVNANSGANITQAVGLQEDPNDPLKIDPEYDSWALALGQNIETVLVGEEGQQNGLYDTLYLTFLLPVVFIGAIVIIFNGIRRRAVEVLTGALWMLAVIVAGIVFLLKPMVIPQTIDAVIGTVSTEMNKAIIGAGNDAQQGCEPTEEAVPNESKRNAKATECYIWYNTIFKTWAQGQFGVQFGTAAKSADILNADYENVLKTKVSVGGQSLTYDSMYGWAAYQLENGHNPLGSNVAIAMSKNGNVGYFSGSDKTGSAFLALSVSLASAIFIGINALIIIAYQIIMLLLLLTAPIFLIMGVMPSRTGKGIVLRWAELIIGLAVKRLVIILMLAIFIKMFLVITLVPNIPMFIQAVLFAILAYIGITQRGKIMELFTANINFGGTKSINVGGSIEKLGENAMGIAGGAALATAGWVGARGMAKAKMGIVQRRSDAFQKKLDAASSPEERQTLIQAQQAQLNKKTRQQELLRGGTMRGAEEKMLDDQRYDNQFDAQQSGFRGTRESIQNAREDINKNTNNSVGRSTGRIIGETRQQGEVTRNTTSAESQNTREIVERTGDTVNDNINYSREENNKATNTAREQLRGAIDRSDTRSNQGSNSNATKASLEQSKARLNELRNRSKKPPKGDTPPRLP